MHCILSQFNYDDAILQNLTENLQNKIQKLQKLEIMYKMIVNYT